MGSARLPGKMLMRLGGQSILEWVLARVARAAAVDELILATSVLPGDDELADLAAHCGVRCVRGSEQDVLGRFVLAADATGADIVVRVCADNPFVDPGEIDRLVAHFLYHPCDYACNHQDRLGSGYADGFGAEILRADLLRRIAGLAVKPQQREHVTLYLWDYPSAYRLAAITAPVPLAHPQLRFDLDTADDFAHLSSLVAAGVGPETTAAEIVALELNLARASTSIPGTKAARS
jgi:spore coat polysaccharide biosynthesis protein SpsF